MAGWKFYKLSPQVGQKENIVDRVIVLHSVDHFLSPALYRVPESTRNDPWVESGVSNKHSQVWSKIKKKKSSPFNDLSNPFTGLFFSIRIYFKIGLAIYTLRKSSLGVSVKYLVFEHRKAMNKIRRKIKKFYFYPSESSAKYIIFVLIMLLCCQTLGSGKPWPFNHEPKSTW